MYDFCLSYPYAVVLAIGGLAGFAAKGSIPSLVAGLGSAAIVGLCAHLSFSFYTKGKTFKIGTFISLVVAGGLTYEMYQRYMKTGKIFPAAIICALSAVMSLFYVWSFLLGPTPKAKPSKDT